MKKKLIALIGVGAMFADFSQVVWAGTKGQDWEQASVHQQQHLALVEAYQEAMLKKKIAQARASTARAELEEAKAKVSLQHYRVTPAKTVLSNHSKSKPVAKSRKPVSKQSSDSFFITPPKTRNMSQHEQAILAAKSNHYTIQIMLDKDPRVVKAFKKQARLSTEKAHVYREPLKSGLHYGLAYGDFAKFSEAEEALNKLSVKSKRWGAYIRKISGNQHAIMRAVA